MKSIECNLCKRCETVFVLDDRASFLDFGRTIVRCKQCGLLFVNPQPDWDELAKVYNYFQNNTAINAMPVRTNERILRRVSLLKNIIAPSRILDAGCGKGEFLVCAREAGLEGIGVEASARLAASAREKKLDVSASTIEDFCRNYKGELFGLVTMWEVIEHLRDPSGVVRMIFNILKPSGMLALSTPNAGGISARMKRERWKGFIEDRCHLFFFDRKTLCDLLIDQGFSIKKIFTKKIPQAVFKPLTLLGLGNELEVYAEKAV